MGAMNFYRRPMPVPKRPAFSCIIEELRSPHPVNFWKSQFLRSFASPSVAVYGPSVYEKLESQWSPPSMDTCSHLELSPKRDGDGSDSVPRWKLTCGEMGRISRWMKRSDLVEIVDFLGGVCISTC
ncbi:hypothetical protein EVAR_99484_1 [Eumeta japonica]|uniref:Uncharacterized protein n=1 Tax=Eumeta variegata TaxID=151549 RepID=A0A4C2A917_EUMVA|nr:hypothetical protein EVAR_99484_1 [Eumeta japonica]